MKILDFDKNIDCGYMLCDVVSICDVRNLVASVGNKNDNMAAFGCKNENS